MTDVLERQWLRTDTSDNCDDTIAARFEEQVAAVPDKLAIVTDEVSLTYRALDLEASRMAAALSALPCDRPIILFIKEDVTRIVAMLGVLKANRIFIPLSPNSPQKWLNHVIEDSGAAQIIVDRSTRSVAELAAPGNLTVMEAEQLAQSSQPFVVDRVVSPDDVAYIVYTSGSTGRSKGVANSHRRLIRTLNIRYSLFELGRDDRYANVRSSGFSSAINNTFLPLLSGGCLFPFDLHRHGLQKLAPWFIAQNITYVNSTGSLLRAWFALLPDDVRFPALRSVSAAGERLYAQDVVRMSRHLEGDWRIGHSYSSTESGTIAAQVFTPSRLPEPGVVAVGHPVDGVEVCIKDETGALVASGEIGEIIVRSRFLAQGYWNHPELTAKAFETDPLDRAIRIYRTGDLGRWRSDGTLEFIGRKGRRIRLRGTSIEPFEVECELMRQSGVTDAVVMLRDRADGEEPCLVAYVVSPPNTSPSTIRKGLAERLPSYMVPSHIVVLDSFPLTSSGKIDRNALPPPRWDETHLLALRAPSDDREHQLLAIWQEVLRLPTIGVDNDFFELGGTSLQALMVFAQIEARLGCSLPPTTLVQASTIARLAELIRATTGSAASQSLVPLRASRTGLPLFLVSGRGWLVMNYRHLLNDLKSDRPIYGLQPPPLDGKHRIPRTITSMATDYVSEIQRVQPYGPYFIAGHSFGGRVSFEIAQQLVGKGERVSFLGLIDTSLRDTPIKGWPLASEAVHLGRRVRRAQGFHDFLFQGLRFARNTLLDLWIRQGHSIPHKYRPTYYPWLCSRSNIGYVPKPYRGHITMFSSAGNSERQRAHWGPLARGGLTVLEVPAGHMEMIEPPHSRLLAEHFDACLDPAGVQERVGFTKRS